MTTYYVDTSALVKRYVPETGSEWVVQWSSQSADNVLIICALTTVEMVSHFARREREGAILTPDRVQMQNHFLRHVDDEYLVVDLEPPVLEIVRQLLVKYPLRALDSLQLAGAVEAVRLTNSTPIFIRAEKRLLNAATAEGFSVINPNQYP